MSKFINKLKFSRKSSEISSSSLIFPWHTSPLIGVNIQTGRTVESSEFYLFYISNMLLILAMCMLGIGFWSILIKIPYTYLVNCSLELGFYTIPSAILCFPCFWIILSVHNHDKSRKYLTLALILLIFAITFVVTGTYMGLTHRFRSQPSPFLKEFNETMHDSIKLYAVKSNYRKAWDFIQAELECCGIERYDDWIDALEMVPQSCYVKKSDELRRELKQQGCLKRVVRYMASITYMLNGFYCSVLIVQCLIFTVLAGICLRRSRKK